MAPRKIQRIIIGLIATILLATLYGSQQTKPDPTIGAINKLQPGLVAVTSVVDGDTIEVSIEGVSEKVRLIGIDTPETKDPRKPVQCFGQAASSKMKELVEGKGVKLVAEPGDSDRDKYQRLLRYAYLPDGSLVNATMVSEGYAFAYTVFPFSKLEEFRALEQQARAASRGLWSGCTVDESKAVKQTVSKP